MPANLYHADIDDTSRTAASYWEASAGESRPACPPLEADEACDVAIIGGGYTGLSAALHLARDHDIEARVLEAGPIAWGASGRNGGFCVVGGSKRSIGQLIRRHGLEETRRFHASQCEAVDLVHRLCESEGIDCDRRGNGQMVVAHSPHALAALREEAAIMSAQLGIPATMHDPDSFRAIGHDSTEQHGGMQLGVGFALHPLKFAIGLARAAQRHGAGLHGHSRVIAWERRGDHHLLRTAGGTLRAQKVIVATNGYYHDGLHPGLDHRLLPVISNIITTRPLTDEELARHAYDHYEPVVNTRRLLFYYRLLPDHRILFGARGDSTGTPADGERMKAWMIRRLGEVFPGWRDIEISHFWRGLICVSRRLAPSMGRLAGEPGVWYALAYHGNGVNTAPWMGMRLARAVAGDEASLSGAPEVFRGLPPRFPLPGLRIQALRAVNLLYRLRDLR